MNLIPDSDVTKSLHTVSLITPYRKQQGGWPVLEHGLPHQLRPRTNWLNARWPKIPQTNTYMTTYRKLSTTYPLLFNPNLTLIPLAPHPPHPRSAQPHWFFKQHEERDTRQPKRVGRESPHIIDKQDG